MGKNMSPPSHRLAWYLLRLALLWARKGGQFKRRLFLDLSLLPSYLKNRRHGDATDRLRYHEREFSFDDTPAFHFKIHRPASLRLPRLPCIRPSVNFDDDDEIFIERCKAMKLLDAGASCEENEHGYALDTGSSSSVSDLAVVEEGEEEEQAIDLRAENFIMEFYEQIKLQRQVSYLEYNEMLHRGMSY